MSYDTIGNPTNYMGAAMTWYGRQLMTYSKSGTSVNYTYDGNGLRTRKTVGSDVYDYYYVDGQLAYEKKNEEYQLFYSYDTDGRLAIITKNDLVTGTNYSCYVITNTRGDVLEIKNGSGTTTIKYNYDAWGKLISATNANGVEYPAGSFAYQNSV